MPVIREARVIGDTGEGDMDQDDPPRNSRLIQRRSVAKDAALFWGQRLSRQDWGVSLPTAFSFALRAVS
jgi:hypothetical protein